MSKMYVPANVARFDEHRNSSRVFPVEPGSAARYLAWAARWRAENPREAAWWDAGAPFITSQAEHIHWFGVPYEDRRSRSKRSSGAG